MEGKQAPSVLGVIPSDRCPYASLGGGPFRKRLLWYPYDR
jgi:hypothetical protein